MAWDPSNVECNKPTVFAVVPSVFVDGSAWGEARQLGGPERPEVAELGLELTVKLQPGNWWSPAGHPWGLT